MIQQTENPKRDKLKHTLRILEILERDGETGGGERERSESEIYK